ncbi:MAG: hypothetical protein JNK58_13195 [Phycisphaerae bacterium]|nr:hypothetical protein [Phycisphaerae bacterium]
MARTILIPTRFSGPWARAAAILIAGGVLAAASALIGPASSSARTLSPDAQTNSALQSARQASLDAARAAKWPAYLGSLTGARHTVEVYVGRNGPLYTVKDNSGTILATQITSEEVYARFPDLTLRDMHAEAEPARASDH